MSNYPIADLHCDLLCYLSGDVNRSPFDSAARCSIDQLKEGNVKLQTMAIYTPTEVNSTLSGEAQVQCYSKLLRDYSNYFQSYNSEIDLKTSEKISIQLAIENGSAFFEENENLDLGFSRLNAIEKHVSKIQYLSFTWNSSNRFGGGAYENKGITSDGIELLHFLSQKEIAVDLSHSSDLLAYDILNEIDRRNIKISMIASHSNARSVTNVTRNLPDELIKEIIGRNGIIGFNFVRNFLGKGDISNFSRHLDHFLSLGAENNLCFGADFFYGLDVPIEHRKLPEDLFFPDYDHAGVYSKVIWLWKKYLNIDNQLIEKISYKNLQIFLEQKNSKLHPKTQVHSVQTCKQI